MAGKKEEKIIKKIEKQQTEEETKQSSSISRGFLSFKCGITFLPLLPFLLTGWNNKIKILN